MDAISQRREAQARADRIGAFREELAALEREGALTLTEEQRLALDKHLGETLASLSGRFDLDLTASQRRLSWGMRIVSALGGLAFCTALFFFVYRFWGLLSEPSQVGLLTAIPLVALAATEFSARRERTLYFASLLSLVAFAAFVIDLSVLGTIFNLSPSPGAFLAWGLFGLALAYRYGLRLPLVSGLVCLVVFLGAIAASWRGIYWTNFPERPETLVPGGLLLLGIPWVAPHPKLDLFPATYRLAGLAILFLALLLLSVLEGSSLLPVPPRWAEYIYQILSFSAASLGIWIGIKRSMTGVVNLSAAFFVVSLYARLTEWWWSWMPKYLFFLLLGLIALALLAAFQRLRRAVGRPA